MKEEKKLCFLQRIIHTIQHIALKLTITHRLRETEENGKKTLKNYDNVR